MKRIYYILVLAMLSLNVCAWKGMEMKKLHVEGRWLCDADGNHVNLHGFGQTYSAYFNGYAWCRYTDGNINWDESKNASKCVAWNKEQISKMLDAGWKVNWLRLHMDPYWSNDDALVNAWKQQHPGENYSENHTEGFSETLFRKYLDDIFIPMAKYAIENGIYVVMRPPGVCPRQLTVGDSYHQYLRKVWSIVCSHKDLKNNDYIMFELANEPIDMNDGSGNYSSSSDGSQKKCTEFFQQIVDDIRALGCNNILWVPGLAYQQNYQGYVKYPIVEKANGLGIGYAVHCYPGWYGSDSEVASAEQKVETNGAGYVEFLNGWENSISGVAANSPILVTEMDWAPKKYNSSWGKATTGVEGGVGFGANFRFIMDKTGNVSWMLFTDADKLALYDDNAPDGDTFLTDPQACVRPVFRWFQQYTDSNFTSYSAEREKHILDSIQAAKEEEMAASGYVVKETDEVKSEADNLDGRTLFVTDNSYSLLYVNSTLESPQNVRTGTFNDIAANPMCFLKFSKVTNAQTTMTGNLYTIQMAQASGATYSLWGDNGYLNTPPGEWCLFALGLKNQYGQDARNYGLWKVDYEDGKGYTIQNVGAGEAGGKSWLNPASAVPVAEKCYVRMYTKLTKSSTGIDTVTQQYQQASQLYNLNGQRITTPRPGSIVIRNGKKYIK